MFISMKTNLFRNAFRSFSTFNRSVMIPDNAVKQIFTEARTHYSFTDKTISSDILKKVYDMAKMGPSSFNCSPLRVLYIQSSEAKERLLKYTWDANKSKVQSAPVTAVLALDPNFHDKLDILFPANSDGAKAYLGNPETKDSHMVLNGTMQAGYFVLAARACGLDCGPMSGLDFEGINKEFFFESGFKTCVVVNLGYGDMPDKFPRPPRFNADDVTYTL